MPAVHSVQTFVRVIYTDGVVAGITVPSEQLDPLSPLPERARVAEIVNRQATMINNQIKSMTINDLHEAARLSSSQVAADHKGPQPKASAEGQNDADSGGGSRQAG